MNLAKVEVVKIPLGSQWYLWRAPYMGTPYLHIRRVEDPVGNPRGYGTSLTLNQFRNLSAGLCKLLPATVYENMTKIPLGGQWYLWKADYMGRPYIHVRRIEDPIGNPRGYGTSLSMTQANALYQNMDSFLVNTVI